MTINLDEKYNCIQNEKKNNLKMQSNMHFCLKYFGQLGKTQ